MQKKIICLISTYPTEGDGISKYVEYLITALAQNFKDYEILTRRINFLQNKLHAFKWLWLFFRRDQIVHLQYTPTGAGPLVLFYSIFRAKKSRFIITSHELPSMYAKHLKGFLRKLYLTFEKKLFATAEAVTVHYPGHVEELKKIGVDPKKITLIPMPVFYPKSSDKGILRIRKKGVFLGRIAPKKGLELLISAVQYLPEDFSIEIVGGPPRGFARYASALQKNVLEKGLENRIKFTGYQSDSEVSKHLFSSGYVVLPHKYASFSAIFGVAFGHGLPYIASDLPAFKTFHDEFEGGILFKTENARKLADAILKIQETALFNQCLHQQKKSRKILDWAYFVKELRKIYE